MKIILDTNVLSELAMRDPEPRVDAWVNAYTPEELWTTSTTLSEIVCGVMRMPEGRRKNDIDDRTSVAIKSFHDRTVAFDGNAAIEYGRFMSDLRASGRNMKRSDGQIAACCIANGAILATRNTKDFAGIPGLEVLNPWDHEG